MINNSQPKIAIILDTNILEKGEKEFDNMATIDIDQYDQIINIIEENYLGEQVTIFLTDVTYRELKQHKIDRLKNKLCELKKYKDEFEGVDEIELTLNSLDIETHIDRICKDKSNDVYIIDVPKDYDILFNKILKMALSKEPPFNNNKNSDKGFKDAIIYQSIISFAKNHEFNNFILFTLDSGFIENKNKLQNNFKLETNKDLEIINQKDVLSWVMNKFNIDIDFSRYFNSEFSLILEEDLEDLDSIDIDSDTFVVVDVEKDNANTKLEKLDQSNFKLTVWINGKYIKENSEFPFSDWFAEYIFTKKEGNWEYNKKYNHRMNILL